MGKFNTYTPGKIPVEQSARLKKPLLIWDGNCGFCKYWVIRWEKMTGEKVDYAPYQEVADQFIAIPEVEFRKAAFLIEPNGNIYRGMGAAFRTFTYGERWSFLYHWYVKYSLFRRLSDWVYSQIARNRPLLYKITIAIWGRDPHK